MRWISAESNTQLYFVGAVWVVLTIFFEFVLGWYVLNYSWQRMIEDYNLFRGGLLGIGMVVMLFAPFLAEQLCKRLDR